MKIVFFGTPSFAAETLAYLVHRGVEVVAVVTRPDKPKGRSGKLIPPPVKITAKEKIPNVPVFQPVKASTPEFIKILSQFSADVFVVVAYGEIISQQLLDVPKKACINVHASLLPKYRGAAPIQRCIIDGERETGVTIMHMVKKLDAGDMLKQVKIPIGPHMNSGDLHDELQKHGCKALFETLQEIEQGIDIRVPQDESLVTYAGKIKTEDCLIDWTLPGRDVYNKFRGVTPRPGAFCLAEIRGVEKRMKILQANLVQGYTDKPGQILTFGKDGLIVSCGKEALRLIEVKLEGKKAMKAEEFCRGLQKDQILFIVA